MISRQYSGSPEDVRAMLSRSIGSIVDNVQCYVKDTVSDMSRCRKLPPEKVLKILLSMGSSALKTEICSLLPEGEEVQSSAFCMQRYKFTLEAFVRLFNLFTSSVSLSETFNGFTIIATDGSDINIPFDPNDQDTLVKGIKGARDHSAYHLNALYDVLTGIYYDIHVSTPSKTEEVGSLLRMAERHLYPSGSIIVGDRGYVSYKAMATFNETGQKYVIHSKDIDCPSSILHRHGLPAAEFDRTVTVSLTRSNVLYKSSPSSYALVASSSDFPFLKSYNRGTYELTFRVVRFMLDNGCYESLVTNLSEKEMPLEAMKDLYHLRWNEETSFRTLKYNLGLVSFHSKKREGILQEMYCRLVMFNAASAIIGGIEVSRKDGSKYDASANRAVAITNVKLFLRGLLSASGLISRIKKYLVPVRPGRSYGRKIRTQSARPFYYRLS